MIKEKSFTIRDKNLTAHELTVGQISKIIERLEKTDINDIDMMLPDRIPSEVLAISMDMKLEDLGDYTPSEIEVMLDAAEETNPTFAGLMQRLASVGRQVLAEKESGEQSAD